MISAFIVKHCYYCTFLANVLKTFTAKQYSVAYSDQFSTTEAAHVYLVRLRQQLLQHIVSSKFYKFKGPNGKQSDSICS